jgi:hypothetical protein
MQPKLSAQNRALAAYTSDTPMEASGNAARKYLQTRP